MKTLYRFQHEGTDFLVNGGKLLAFQPGAGKTVTAIEACKRVGARRVLVICPAVALGVWRDEVADHWPEAQPMWLRERTLFDHARPLVVITSYDYVVVNKEALRALLDIRPYDVLVCDEAHNLKTPTAKRTMLVYGPGCTGADGLVSLAKHVWLLTGTPVLNHAGELFSHLNALAPERIAQRSYDGFIHRYCETGIRKVRTRAGITRNIETITGTNRAAAPELAARLRGFWLKPKLEELNAQLPPLRFVVRTLAPDACDPAAIARIDQSAEATLLRQAIEAGRKLDDLEVQAGKMRRLLAAAKVDATVKWVENLFEEGVGKVCVWGWHVAALEQIAGALRGLLITGKTPSSQRARIVERFQAVSKEKVFVGQIQAAGTAITLTAAHRAVFIEQSFVPAANYQALKRCHRIGQKQPVLGEALVVAGSIDEAVGRLLARKSAEISLLEESA